MTPVIDPDAPWWANLLVVVLVLVGSTWLMNRPTRKTLRKVAADAKTAADQTANSHADAEFPNLRDELTRSREHAAKASEKSEQAAADARAAKESAHRTERYVADLAETIHAAEHSQDRRHKQNVDAIKEVRDDLDQHLADVPGLVAEAVRQAQAPPTK